MLVAFIFFRSSMSKARTVYIHIVLLCSTQLGLCMDDLNAKKTETPRIYPAIPAASSAGSPQSVLNSSNGTALNNSSDLYSSGSYSWSFNPISFVTGLVSSALTTAYNKMSPEAPFYKIGYPSTSAQEGLTTCIRNYKNILNTNDAVEREKILQYIFRRTEYLVRVFCALPTRTDFGAVTVHCQSYHQPAMPMLLKDWYNKYFEDKVAEQNELREKRRRLNESLDVPVIPEWEPIKDAYSLQITIPTVSSIVESFWNNANSAYETVKNELSDDKAFLKLGWPINNSSAREQLIKTLSRYDKVLLADTEQERIDAVYFVLRRTFYLVRAFLALQSRSDGAPFATHLILYHKRAMFPVLLQLFEKFTADNDRDLQLKKDALLKKLNNHSESMNNKIGFNFGKLTNKNAEEVKKSPEAADCFLLKQQHGTTGFVVTQETRNTEKLSQLGDFLVTNIPVPLGILTADCLPIIFNDKNKAIGIAHAGWRGSVDFISKAVLESMQRHYQTKPEDVSIIFGPCIHPCCYKVGQELISRVNAHSFGEKTIIKRGDDHFFDLLAFNKALLISLGVKEAAIDTSNSKCTSCNKEYHSHRREGEQAGRQLSTVWIE